MRPSQRQKKSTFVRYYLQIKILLFFGIFFLLAFIGLLFPFRPSSSTLEKRELEAFPSFSVESFLDGSFFKQIDTWFADTYPLREPLLVAEASFKNLYGIQTEQIHGTLAKGDDIPASNASNTAPADERESSVQTEEETTSVGETQGEEKAAIATPEAHGTVYISGNRAFGLYYFSLDGANRYINFMNTTATKLRDKANIYTLLAPTSIGIMLDEAAREEIGASNQEEAFSYIYGGFDAAIKTVNVYRTLKEHNSEYLYFNTDHHWTALGAYYTYEAFAAVKGIIPTPLNSYEVKTFPDFLGTYYASSNQASVLAENTDTITAYVPRSTNDLIYLDKNGEQHNWPIINDVSNYNTGVKYSCFIAGDNPLTTIVNPLLTDNSSCVVIKESYGNAFVPFLVDHYQTVYVIDYRYYSGNLETFVDEHQIDDVIFLNNADAINNSAIALMEKLNQ